MSGVTAMGVLAAAAVAGTAYSVYNGQQQASAQKDAAQKAQKNAAVQADAADQANNRANGKTPDIAAMLGANQGAAKGGASGTMLTGPQGLDPTQLQLGRSTLLGQ